MNREIQTQMNKQTDIDTDGQMNRQTDIYTARQMKQIDPAACKCKIWLKFKSDFKL